MRAAFTVLEDAVDSGPFVREADVIGLYEPDVAAALSDMTVTWINGDPLGDDVN